MDWEQFIHLDQRLTLMLNGSDSLFMDGVMMTITSTWTWIPLGVVLLYVLIKNNEIASIGLILVLLALCILFADQMSSGFCKPYFHRFRPTNDPLLMYQVDVVNNYRGGQYGFFSSHASNTFSLCVFLSLLFRHRMLSLLLTSWALLNCYSRIYLGVHYLGDVLVGILWGSLVGFFFYFVYKKIAIKLNRESHSFISSQYTSTGYLIIDMELFKIAILLTYLFVLFKALFINY